MPKIINVPQGYSARMMKDTLDYEIVGLYTEGFSSCNIVACIGKEKLILMHVDSLSAFELGKVPKEMQWVEAPRTIVLMYRNNIEASTMNKASILEEFERIMPDEVIVTKDVGAAVDRVFISFDQQIASEVHPNVKFLDMPPRDLIHHPQEQQFLAVQKIEQFVGLRARHETKSSNCKKTHIFDGRAWEPMVSGELEVYMESAITKQEMQYFNKTDVCLVLARKLEVISKRSSIPFSCTPGEYIDVAYYLEEYLNDYNYALLFKRNFKELIDGNYYIPKTKADKLFNATIKQSLAKSDDVFAAVTQIINQHRHSAPDTEFRTLIVRKYDSFARLYRKRKSYADLNQINAKLKQQALIVEASAIEKYDDDNYISAIVLFWLEIKLLAYSSMKSDPNMANAYYNYGMTLSYDKNYKEAKYFLSICLDLKNNYTEPMPNERELEKTRSALKACEGKKGLYFKATSEILAKRLPQNAPSAVKPEEPMFPGLKKGFFS